MKYYYVAEYENRYYSVSECAREVLMYETMVQSEHGTDVSGYL